MYGEAAIAAFAGGGYAFDCDFINGAQSMTFRNDTATILKTDGTSETHTYGYLGKYNVGETETMMHQGTEIPMTFPVDAYKSTDEAGEFKEIPHKAHGGVLTAEFQPPADFLTCSTKLTAPIFSVDVCLCQ